MNTSIPQIRLHGAQELRLDRLPEAPLGADEALIEVAACGICGTDLGFLHHGSLRPDGQPMPLGHEFSGVIVAVGAAVERFVPGMRVVVNPMANGALIGSGSDAGALAPRIRVRAQGDALHEIPAHLALDVAALTEPLAVSLHALNRSRMVAGERALVLGAGAIGLGLVALLKQRGVGHVLVADTSERRLEIASALGADRVVNPAREDLWQALGEVHGSVPTFLGTSAPGTDLVFESTGAASLLEEALGRVRDGARITVAGVYKRTLAIDSTLLLVKELELIGTLAYPSEFPTALKLLAAGGFDAAAMISHRFALDDYAEAFRTAADPQVSAKVLVLPRGEI